MWLGRKVRVRTIFLFCALALWSGAGVHGAEEASGFSGWRERNAGVASVLRQNPSNNSQFFGLSRVDDSVGLTHRFVCAGYIPATSLPHSPGTVCFGVLGFVCVSLVRNRRIWIGVCLSVLSNGRLGAARFFRMNASSPELTGLDSPTENGVDDVLWHQPFVGIPTREGRGASSAVGVPMVLTPGWRNLFSSQDGASFWQLEKGQLPWVVEVREAAERVRWGPVGSDAVSGPGVSGCSQWARPPPGRTCDSRMKWSFPRFSAQGATRRKR